MTSLAGDCSSSHSGPSRLLGLSCYMLVVCTIILFLKNVSSYRAEKYGPVVRVNAFHRISVLIVSPEGVKVLKIKPNQ